MAETKRNALASGTLSAYMQLNIGYMQLNKGIIFFNDGRRIQQTSALIKARYVLAPF